MRKEGEFSPEASEALSSAEERLYAILVPELEAARIDPAAFADLYGEATVAEDGQRVARIRSKFEVGGPALRKTEKRGALFEAIVGDQIEASEWLGENATYVPSSRFDDYVNGVDGIVEFEEESSHSHVALATDLTKSERSIHDKFEAIRRSIASGVLSRVKYFIGSGGRFRGELSQIPRVVIGADERTMQELSELIFEFRSLKKTLQTRTWTPEAEASLRKRFREVRKKLEQHPLQRKILQETIAQLNAFASCAERNGQSDLAAIFQHMLGIFEQIVAERPAPPGEDFGDDPVYRLIIEEARSLESHRMLG